MIPYAVEHGDSERARLILIVVGLSVVTIDSWVLNLLYLVGAIPILWFTRGE